MNRLYNTNGGHKSTCDNEQDNKKKGCKHHDKCYDMDDKNDGNCVEDVLEAILRAQRKVSDDGHCETSCHESINDLLGKKRKTTKNTVPFILYCGCEPFKGTGVLTYSCHSNKKKKLKCIESFIFKVKGLKGDCAVLELLTFKCDLKYNSDPCNCNSLCSPCCQIDGKCIDDLTRTGICITVDLSRFTTVTCLPAVYL
jgi:hypothetical protein